MKRKLIIVNSEQFGYNNATYYYCKYLKDRYKITYIGWDHGLDRIIMDGVSVVNVKRSGGFFRVLRFLKVIHDEARENTCVIIVKYFKIMSVLIRIMKRSAPMVLDIRTGSVAEGKVSRIFWDAVLRFEVQFYKNVTVISSGLIEKFSLSKKARLLPLGAEAFTTQSKNFDCCMHMLYVGTFYNRNIEKVVKGAERFIREYSNLCDIKLTLVGDGLRDELARLRNDIEKAGMQQFINLPGRVPHNKLKVFFDNHNIGISYVPITNYYTIQPATKTFEYLLSGMAVIATKTMENKSVVNATNGVLIADTAKDVYEGMVQMYKSKKEFSSAMIRENAWIYSWENVVSKMASYLDEII